MNFFNYKNRELYCEDVKIKDIADDVGTPVYIYSKKTLKRHYAVLSNAFTSIEPLICYSVKANSNIANIALFASMGAGADIVSGGELYRALKAGIKADRIVYSGVGKTEEEIAYAIKENILLFNAESIEEIDIINSVAKKLKKKARVGIRINPDIDPQTHPYISTGLKKNKFGIDSKYAVDAYKYASSMQYLIVNGIDMHIGSQLTTVSPIVSAINRAMSLVQKINQSGINIQYMDIGGGLGITYKDELPPVPQKYAKAIEGALANFEGKLILEPGRVLVGNAGILVGKVLYRKYNGKKRFMIIDAAMNDLIRPSLYNAYHSIIPVKTINTKIEKQDVVGPICESGDFFAKDRNLHLMDRNELVAIMSAGAYGFSMSSNYNSRRRAAEVLVDGSRYYIIRRRETLQDLIKGETLIR
ncbi:MAG: diaminopimelate decarboxylase [Deltaproteobacteria bacterium]|nr:diaminopimelate decarboxylase [Deltaproteobacteria bacterium]MCL5791716.1 diaminopimelate decarboxylase [Deltaproteobacteria bacterium]